MVMPEIRLTPEDRKKLEELEADIAAMDREITKAERVGIDVAQLKADFEKAKKLREGLLREYG